MRTTVLGDLEDASRLPPGGHAPWAQLSSPRDQKDGQQSARILGLVADTDSPISAAYNESVRALTAQAAAVDALRGRAGTVIAVASLITTLLGGQILVKPSFAAGKVVIPPITFWGWAAIGVLILIAVLVLAIMWPYRWAWSERADALIGMYESSETVYPKTLVAAQRELALHLQARYDANEQRMMKLSLAFRAASILLVCETILWLVDLHS